MSLKIKNSKNKYYQKYSQSGGMMKFDLAKIFPAFAEELNTLISDRISLSELSLKSKVLKN